MKRSCDTALFSPCFLEGKDLLGNDRLKRNIRWVQWYRDRRWQMGPYDMWMADNASDPEDCKTLEAFGVSVYRFRERLTRTEGDYGYPYCWRALYFVRELIEAGYKKIIFCDSDGYVLNRNITDYVMRDNEGWWSLYCPRHKFPESSFHVLNKDSFDIFLKYTSEPWENKVGKRMETDLPFTRVMRGFDADRYGEERTAQVKEMDYYGQRPLDIPLSFAAV